MKTNVTLVSKSRELYGVTIIQETKTEFISLSHLQEAYNVKRITEGWSEKRISDVLSSSTNAERIFYILQKQEFIDTSFPVFMDMVSKEGLIRVLKRLGCYSMRGRSGNRVIVCNPYIWVLVAMEMNPMIYAEVVSWLTDGLIINRIGAGDMYVELSRSLSRFSDVDYQKIAKALNHIVFGRHETGIRNTGTKDQLKELATLEASLSHMIETDLVTSFDEVMGVARKMWHIKQQKNNGGVPKIH